MSIKLIRTIGIKYIILILILCLSPSLAREKVYIGYTNDKASIFLILSSLGIATNILFVFRYSFRLIKKKKNKTSSLEKIMLALSFAETGISICWFLSAKYFPSNEDIRPEWNDPDNYTYIPYRGNVSNGCSIIADFQIFFYIIDWLFICFSILQVKNIILNPVESVLNAKKKLRKYFFISFSIGIIGLLLTEIQTLYGKSPLITCSLRIDLTKREKIHYFGPSEEEKALNITYNPEKFVYATGIIKIASIIIICCIPLGNIGVAIFQTIKIYSNPEFEYDNENKRFLKSYSKFIITYLVSSLLFFSLYVFDLLFKVKSYKILQYYFFVVSLIFCLTPCIVGLIRIFTTNSLDRFIQVCREKNSQKEELLYDEFGNFESKSVSKFVINIYLSVCYCLHQKKEETIREKSDLNPKNSSETIEHNISNQKLIESGLESEIKSRNNIQVKCIEFASEIFKYLRKLDGIDDEIMKDSFLPTKNVEGIKESEGRGGSFFINTDDKKYMIKTINYEELELIRKKFIQNLAEHLWDNKNSLIGRIYGVYKIETNSGLFQEDEIIFIVMKNVFGVFNDNVFRKYDMKGSKKDRKVLKEGIVPGNKQVLKDIDFKELEKCLLLTRRDSKRLIDNVIKDADFFCKLGIMDYSLLVIKLEINEDEMKFIFGSEHKKYIQREIKEIKEKIEETNIDENESYDIINNDYSGNIRFPNEDFTALRKYFFPCLNTKYMYIISIIDFLQLYNLRKNLETKFKKIKAQIEDISSVPPELYKERYIEFCKNIVDKDFITLKINEQNL